MNLKHAIRVMSVLLALGMGREVLVSYDRKRGLAQRQFLGVMEIHLKIKKWAMMSGCQGV